MHAFEHIEITDRAALRAWLEAHHRQSESVWLVTYKKHCGDRFLPYDDVIDELLCFGWIDSHVRKVDADRKKLLISPRRPGSIWSRLNKTRVERLDADGRMTDAGRAKIEAAKADGSWTLYDECEARVVPPDLAAAFAAVPGSADRWDGFGAAAQKGILWWIKSAKTAATRQKRIAETARLAGLGLRANHPEAKGR